MESPKDSPHNHTRFRNKKDKFTQKFHPIISHEILVNLAGRIYQLCLIQLMGWTFGYLTTKAEPTIVVGQKADFGILVGMKFYVDSILQFQTYKRNKISADKFWLGERMRLLRMITILYCTSLLYVLNLYPHPCISSILPEIRWVHVYIHVM